MSAAPLRTLRGLAGRVRARFGPKCVILLYHRIADAAADPYLLTVGRQHFEEHLEAMQEVGSPISLAELVRRLAEGTVPDRAICVTFDDGYQDNLYVAKPLLEQYNIPATVFMTTGAGGRTREFWWDELAGLFMEPGSLPPRLQLELPHLSLNVPLGSTAHFTESDLASHRSWTVLDEPPTPRHAAFQRIYDVLQRLMPGEQSAILDALLAWAGRLPAVRASHRTLNPAEVASLADGGLVEVGAHTVSHVALSMQPPVTQRREVVESRDTLEEWLGRPVPSFAYPYGLYSDATVAEVRRAGFDMACACLGQPVRRDSDRFLLPRIDAPDIGGEQLARQLNSALAS
jgi:peptidoglycan/xylan/chitin deacetylase (PgdA/CDA1 family)